MRAWWRSSLQLSAAVGAAMLGACGVPERPLELAPQPPFGCQADAECGTGACDLQLGFCVQELERPPAVLLQVMPRSSDAIYGGAQYVGFADGIGDAEDFTVPERAVVNGQINALKEQQRCLAASTTVPVRMRFTPRETRLGLDLPTYELRSQPEISEGQVVQHIFRGSVPPGQYDIYVVPDDGELADTSCTFVPQIFRAEEISENLNLTQSNPEPLRLTLPWRKGREGWTMDMIHAVTGERMSTRVAVPGAESAEVELSFSPVATQDYSGRDDARIRLTPPSGQDAPTLLMQLGNIELGPPSVPEFGRTVEFVGWLGADGRADEPVPGTVTFTALGLSGLNPGIFFTFQKEVAVGFDGRIRVALLPGSYRVRAFPKANSGYAATESDLEILREAAGAAQAGQVVPVRTPAILSGKLEAEGVNVPLGGIPVFVQPSHLTRSACGTSQDAQLEQTCRRAQSQLLKVAFGVDRPRTRARRALSDASGRFDLALDCARCAETLRRTFPATSTGGSLLELQARPPFETGLAWSVSPAVELSGDRELAPRTFGLPWKRRMLLRFGEGGPPLRGALVRAFYLLDQQGRIIEEGTASETPYCIDSDASALEPCILATVQVGEQRSREDGQLLLLLPSTLQ